MEIVNRFIAPKQPATNTDTNLLKLVAMAAMLCDHAGKIFFSAYPVMRMIGRLAFPIYAYCLAVGVVYTKHPMRYVSRVILLALISQPIYAVAMQHTNSTMYAVSFSEQPLRAALNFYMHSWDHPSVLFTLVCGLVLLWAIRNRQFAIAVGMYLLCWKIQGSMDYGIRGIHLMLIFYLTCGYPLLTLISAGAFMLWWGYGGMYTVLGMKCSTQVFAVAALPLICIETNTKIKLPKLIFYLFYPVHLAAIWFFSGGM